MRLFILRRVVRRDHEGSYVGGGLLWWVKVGGIVGGEEADCSGAGGRVVMKVGWLCTVAVEKCRQAMWEIVF